MENQEDLQLIALFSSLFHSVCALYFAHKFSE